MTQHAVTGRRRAETSAAEAYGLRPRDAARRGRRAAARPGPVRQLAEIAGVGQKAGVALAATGLVLTVTLPTAGTDAAAPTAAVDTAQQPQVTASGEAVVAFSRTSVGSHVDPDGRLKQLLSAQSAGGVTAAQAKNTLGAPLDSMVPSSSFG